MVRRVRGSRSKSDRHTGWASLSGGAKGDGDDAVASKRYENDACEWAEGRQVPRDVRSSPPERENHSRWVSHSRGKERGLSVAPSLHTNAGGSTSCSLREKLGVGEEICSHCGERVRCRRAGRPARVSPAPVSVVIVGSLLWFARITGESTRR